MCFSTKTQIYPRKTPRRLRGRDALRAWKGHTITDPNLWRIARLYRDIVFLTRLPNNDRGGCWAGNPWFAKKYKCDVSTVRRWMAILADHGWIRLEIKGPSRLAVPIADPARILFFYRRFARLLAGVLRGSTPVPSYIPERDVNSNSQRGPKSVPAPPALSEAEQAVVVQATNVGVSGDYAPTLVHKCGAETVKEAIEVALWHRRQGKTIQEPGAFVRSFAQNLKAGLWSLPAKFLEERGKAERKAEREKAVAARIVTAPPRPPQDTGSAAPAPSVAPARAYVTTTARAGDVLASMPDGERAALLERAKAALLADPATVRIERDNINRQGASSYLVTRRAAQLLADKGGGA